MKFATHVERAVALARLEVAAGCGHHHEVALGHDEEALAARALRGDPLDFPLARDTSAPATIAGHRRTDPAEIADRLEAWTDRLIDPFRRDDRLATPRAAIEHDLADLCGIARPDAAVAEATLPLP